MSFSEANVRRGRHFVLCNERLLPRFGVDRLLLVLGRSLVEHGHRVTFICVRCDREVVERITPSLRIFEGVGNLSIGGAEERASDLLRKGWDNGLFPDGPPDVFISGGWPFFTAAMVCAERAVRSVFVDAGAVPQDGMPEGALPAQRELRRIRARALPVFNSVLPISEFIRETQTLPDRGSSEGVETVLLGADHLAASLFDAPDGGKADRIALDRLRGLVDAGLKPVMLLGRFEVAGYKNSPVALEVFERILSQVPEARLLVLAREGELTIPASIASAVVMLGFVGDSALNEIMRGCHLGLSLSLWEGFNLPLAEMQWLGKPVLAFSLGAHSEVVADPWMLCAQPDDMVYKAVRILCQGVPAHVSATGRFEKFRDNFGWAPTLERYVSVLTRIAELPAPKTIGHGRSNLAPRLVIVDCTCASIDPANPGVIRVTRRLCQQLQRSSEVLPIFARWDSLLDGYRLLTPSEHDTLATYDGPIPLTPPVEATLEACMAALGNEKTAVLFLPEVLLDGAAQKRVLWARARDLRIAAILYDVIPMSHPLFCAREVVERFPEYLETMAALDAIWSISKASLDAFSSYAARTGLPRLAGEAVQLPGQFSATRRQTDRSSCSSILGSINLLCVCSIEPRKNHKTLVQAYQLLRNRRPELPLKLTLVGHRFAEADDLAAWLERVMREDASIVWSGLLSDHALAEEYRRAAFTVYPSVIEGFGLPIMESLWMGTPCVCHEGGVMAELAELGGCLTVDMMDVEALAAAIERLVTQPALLERLTHEALNRSIGEWSDYGAAIAQRISAL